MANPPEKKLWSWKRFGGKFLVISILVHILFLTGAGYFVVQRIQAKRKLTFQAGPPSPNPATQVVEHKVQMQKTETMSAPQMAKRITSTGLGKVNLPEMPAMPNSSDDVQPMKMQAANLGMNGAMTLPAGAGGPGGGINLPSILADRCSAEGRNKSIQENGGDPTVDTSVINALRWLKQSQNPDGSWGHVYKGGMTGLSLLSFLGHCERPTSGEFGPTVKNALDRIIDEGTNQAEGRLSFGSRGNDWVYQHAICTYALGEAYILTKDERIIPVFKKAIALILAGQRKDGGWSYMFSQPTPTDPDSDTSVTCWMIQALKTAHYSGLNIDGVDASLDKAMGDLIRVQGENGVFYYRTVGAAQGQLTGAAVFCLLIWHHAKDKAVREGLRVLRDGPLIKKGKSPIPAYTYRDKTTSLYAWYYDTQACFQAGGGAWSWWKERWEREILKNQSQEGSWPPPGTVAAEVGGFNMNGAGSGEDAKIYRTSLCTLMLEVYYRYLSNSKVEGETLQ